MVTTMFYHFLAPEGWHPTLEENVIEKKLPKCKVLFLSHTSKLNQQKQWDAVSESAANTRDNMNTFP